MKKLLMFFVCFLLLINSAIAQDSLYTLQNVKKEYIKPYIENSISSSNYTLSKKDPYYLVNPSNTNDYIAIILQQAGNDVLFYFNSNKNSKLDKNILKAMKNGGISYYYTEDDNYANAFEKQVQNIASNTVQTYNFDVWNNTMPAIALNSEDDDTTLKGRIIQVEKGTNISAYLQTPINTANARQGDTVNAVLTNDLVFNGYVIAQQGSLLSGTLKKAQKASYGSRNGRVIIDFNSLTTPDNKTYKLTCEEIDFSVTNEGKLSNSAKKVATGAIIGALGGLLIGALSSDNSIGKAVLIGAGTGLATGVVTSVAQRGVDAELPVYTELDVKLAKPFKAVFY